MGFREWFLQEMATMSKQGIEMSTPENIEYLSGVPRRNWAYALRQKYSHFLMDYINNGEEPETLDIKHTNVKQYPINAHMDALVKQLQDAGIDIKDMSRETRSGDFLSLSPSEEGANRAARRWIDKWVRLSLGVPKELLDRNGAISDPEVAKRVKEQAKNMQASDLVPKVGVLWYPNSMQPNLNSYDDPQEADQQRVDHDVKKPDTRKPEHGMTPHKVGPGLEGGVLPNRLRDRHPACECAISPRSFLCP